MPIYEYRCEDCGELTEMLQRFDDPPLGSCPECGGSVKKLVSAPAFQFKGSGWYVTDYARSSADGDAKGAPDREGAGGGESSAPESAASGSDASESGGSEPKRAGAPGDKPGKSPRGDTAGSSGGKGDSGAKGDEKSGKPAAAGPGVSGS